MIPPVGIDLGTTFSCMSYIDDNGVPVMIANSDGKETTPSVVWCDGKLAYVGKKANDRKLMANSPIYEFIKRDIGKDVAHRYVISGYNFGACGLSAIILKKMRMEAFYFFKKKGLLSQEDSLQSLVIPAVITVPAYFRDKLRHETRLAGIAAGFDVIAIINEPTAAALTYGIQLNKSQKILVFDLGGGTFDVTILEIKNGDAIAIASGGADELGGRDWDEIIQSHLFKIFHQQTGQDIPEDMSWELQKLALEAKFALSESPSYTAVINAGAESIESILFRERTVEKRSSGIIIVDEAGENDDAFYFEERSQDKLSLCKAILSGTLADANLGWNDIDEIVLAGGSSRMPMIPKMLQQLSGKTIRTNIPGYSFDTAIAQGAALFSRNRNRVIDISSKSVGVEVRKNGNDIVKHLIKKNSRLPVTITETFQAEANATLKVYEGDDSENPDYNTLRGKLELGNPGGEVKVTLTVDFNGVIQAAVESNGAKATLKIKSDVAEIDVAELKAHIDKIEIRL